MRLAHNKIVTLCAKTNLGSYAMNIKSRLDYKKYIMRYFKYNSWLLNTKSVVIINDLAT